MHLYNYPDDMPQFVGTHCDCSIVDGLELECIVHLYPKQSLLGRHMQQIELVESQLLHTVENWCRDCSLCRDSGKLLVCMQVLMGNLGQSDIQAFLQQQVLHMKSIHLQSEEIYKHMFQHGWKQNKQLQEHMDF
jgi:hypothetical protein